MAQIGLMPDDFCERATKNSKYHKPTGEQLRRYGIDMDLWKSRRKRYMAEYKKEATKVVNAEWLKAHPITTPESERRKMLANIRRKNVRGEVDEDDHDECPDFPDVITTTNSPVKLSALEELTAQDYFEEMCESYVSDMGMKNGRMLEYLKSHGPDFVELVTDALNIHFENGCTPLESNKEEAKN